jgi:hypothetical protein
MALIQRFIRNSHGGAMLEFAFAMPVMLGMLMGGFEFARFALVNQKMERVTTFVGDLVARAEALDEGDFDDYFAAAGQLGVPFDLFADGNIIVTSVTGERYRPGSALAAGWRRQCPAGKPGRRPGRQRGTAAKFQC